MKKSLLFAASISALILLSAATVQQLRYSRFDKEYYLSAQQIAFVRPGLQLEIRDVNIAGDTVSVDFEVTDARGLPLDINGVFTPGPIAASFILARIPQGETQYLAYTARNVTSPITNGSAEQAAAEGGAAYQKLSDGVYRYTFGAKLPPGFNPNVTHGVGIYAARDLSEFDLGSNVANEVFEFVPSGGPLPAIRDVVATEACNQCHDPLEAHGGVRREVKLCVLCHTPQSTDPDTGNTVDLKVMIHKIHMGEHLPSVQAGQPYQIIGFRQTVFDFSEVAFPQDIRNCETCHTQQATQHAAFLLRPSREACGSCHDDVNFDTGINHPGGPQASDQSCSRCHIPEGDLEFDASIRGAHTVPHQSRQLEGINIELSEITNTGPGENPTVFYKITDNAGQPILPSELASLTLLISGPTTDYSMVIREPAAADSVSFADGFTYTFKAAIPANATGSFALGAEGNRDVLLNPGTTKEFSFRETAENRVKYFAVTDVEPVPRRTVVKDEKCEVCHENLALHGSNRHNATEYCQLCHNPAASDAAVRPQEEFPPQTIDFKFLIHRIHRSEELTRDFTVFGFRSSEHNYNHLLYPGDLRNCLKCHEEETVQAPSRGVLATEAPREFFSPISPTSAVCLSCHDTLDAAAHAFLNIAPFGEACGACHGANAEFSVARSHAR